MQAAASRYKDLIPSALDFIDRACGEAYEADAASACGGLRKRVQRAPMVICRRCSSNRYRAGFRTLGTKGVTVQYQDATLLEIPHDLQMSALVVSTFIQVNFKELNKCAK